jgi:NAD(P)-dependent dehydrogenase (short-subunit alcohol dehydrogenase family)
MALRMAGLGAAVAVVGRRPDPLRETVEAIRAAGGTAAAAPCDVRDPEALAAAVDAIERELGPVNQLVNNAAGNFLSASEDLSPNAVQQRRADRALRHVPRDARGRTPPDRAKQKGEVLSIVTSYVYSGSAFVLPSAAAKAGVLAMMRSLATEWAVYGIRLNALAPGPFPTDGAFSRLMPARSWSARRCAACRRSASASTGSSRTSSRTS